MRFAGDVKQLLRAYAISGFFDNGPYLRKLKIGKLPLKCTISCLIQLLTLISKPFCLIVGSDRCFTAQVVKGLCQGCPVSDVFSVHVGR